MNKKLKQARVDLLKYARQLDRIAKCSQAKKRIMSIATEALLKEFYKY